MRKKIWFILILLLGCEMLFADIIVTKNNEQIECKIIEVGVETLKYKPLDNVDDPHYIVEKAKIKSVIYSNGKTETFDTRQKKQNLYVNEPILYQGQEITFSNKKGFAFVNGDTITEGQYLYLTQQYCVEANRQYLKGEKMRRAGKWLLAFGAPITIIGVGFFVGDDRANYRTIGTALMAVGIPSVVAGVPLFTIGIQQKQKSVVTFNQHRNQAIVSLNIIPKGLGVSLNF